MSYKLSPGNLPIEVNFDVPDDEILQLSSDVCKTNCIECYAGAEVVYRTGVAYVGRTFGEMRRTFPYISFGREK